MKQKYRHECPSLDREGQLSTYLHVPPITGILHNRIVSFSSKFHYFSPLNL